MRYATSLEIALPRDEVLQLKQLWQPYVNTINGMNRVRNVGTWRCLYRQDAPGYRHLPVMVGCASSAATTYSQDFKWL